MASKTEAREWVRVNSTFSTTGNRMVPQERYDALTDEDLRGAVDDLIGDFRVPSGGEYAYAMVLVDLDDEA